MSKNQVVLLGTKGGPAIRPGTRMPTSILLQMDGQTILIDAGLGVTRGICDAGVALTDLDAIIITHLHSDHYLELGPLFHTAWTAGLARSIPVIGPQGLDAYWTGFQQSMDFDISLRLRDEGRPEFAPLADIQVIQEGQFQLGSLSMDVIRNAHPPIDDSFALRLTGQAHSVVPSGDPRPILDMLDFAKGDAVLRKEAV